MINGREYVMEQIRQSLKSAVLPSARASIPPPNIAAVNASGSVEVFARELAAINVKVEIPPTPAKAVEKIIELLEAASNLECGSSAAALGYVTKAQAELAHSKEAAIYEAASVRQADSHSIKEIIAWDDSELPIPDLGPAVRAAGFTPLDARIPTGLDESHARLAELGRAQAGLTGALAGLADTGTLVLLGGPTRPRIASLLPPIHIAIVSKRTIYPSMAQFFAAYPDAVYQSSNLVFITGPSRTADIEQTLTLGVHGPREVYVIIVD